MNFIKNIFIFLLIACTPAAAQKYNYKNLVMEGGGIKGIAYGGAMLELEEKGILKDIVRVAGTSAGAIQASLLAVGYSATEISDIIANTPVESFNDDGFISRGTKRLFNDFGWFKGDSFLATMEQLIFDRTGNRNLTFKDLHLLSTTYPFRDLYVVGADLTEQKSVIFSHETYPNMRVADAVRISMSIPIYYRALWVNPEGKVIENPNPEDKCHLFVDGGILMNYPIEIFDDSRFLSKPSSAGKKVFNKETIGLRLDRMEQINQEVKNGSGIAPYEITDFNSYVSALSSILMRNVNPAHPEDVHRTIFINDLGMSPRVRKILPDEKELMMDSGRKGVQDFLTRTNLVTD